MQVTPLTGAGLKARGGFVALLEPNCCFESDSEAASWLVTWHRTNCTQVKDNSAVSPYRTPR